MNAPEKLYPGIIAILWVVWILFWRASALRTKATERHESAWSRASHIIPLVVGAVLIGIPSVPPSWLHRRVLVDPLPLYWVGTAFVAAGLGFSIWARRHLGTNWSATITLKEGHVLVRHGTVPLGAASDLHGPAAAHCSAPRSRAMTGVRSSASAL